MKTNRIPFPTGRVDRQPVIKGADRPARKKTHNSSPWRSGAVLALSFLLGIALLSPCAYGQVTLSIDTSTKEFFLTGSDSGLSTDSFIGPGDTFHLVVWSSGSGGPPVQSLPTSGFTFSTARGARFDVGDNIIQLGALDGSPATNFTLEGNGTRESYASLTATAQAFLEGTIGSNIAFDFGFGGSPIMVVGVATALDPSAGQLTGSLTQTGIQSTSNMLSTTVQQILGIVPGGGPGGLAVVELPAPVADVMPASLASVSGPAYVVRAQNTGCGCLDGWARGYGIYGNVDGQAGGAGLDYTAGGTQIGVHRMLCDGTRVGLFGGYAYQDLETTAQQSATVNGGQLGAFLHRSDDCGNYYVLLAGGGYDSYDSRRVTATGTANGEFDGLQSALYLERGWLVPHGCFQVRPTAAIQHIYVHQNGFTETGAGANNSTVASINQHSLRSLVGGRISTERCTRWGMATPTVRAQWMHEYLDTSTVAGVSIGGAAATAQGIDLGRDFAVLGLGVSLARSECLTLFVNYDAQLNERTDFHAGSGGLNLEW